MSETGKLNIETASPEETLALGRRLGQQLQPGDVLALVGSLGAGKTQFTKGLADGAGAPDRVTSPTFKLVNEYHGRLVLYHIDAYRLHGPAELVALGCDEFFDGDGAAVVEWADRVEDALPNELLRVDITIAGTASRRLSFTPIGARARRLLGAVA